MKSGTTTLYHYLTQHPEIAANQYQKESEFFSKREAPTDLAPYYRQWLPIPFRRRQIALEASTGYTKQPAFPDVARLLTALPGRKHFIYVLRHPVDRLESHFAHNLAAGEARLQPDGTLPDITHHLTVSRYAFQLDAYRAAFPETPVKIVHFERLKAEPIALVRELCAFLEIDTSFAFTHLPPRNTRSSAFRLTTTQRTELERRLRPDLQRLADEYCFDVARWGLL